MHLTGQTMAGKMRLVNCFILLCFAVSGCAFSKSNMTSEAEVKAFTDNAENCQHFAGEWGNNLPQARQVEIEKSLNKYCGKAKKQKKELSIKYKDDYDVEKILNEYDF